MPGMESRVEPHGGWAWQIASYGIFGFLGGSRNHFPSVVASEVTGALRGFLATGFGPSNPTLANIVDDFLAEPGNLAKGPYLSITLPFQPAPEGGEPFPEVPLGFTPYRHQRIAFSRLAPSSG